MAVREQYSIHETRVKRAPPPLDANNFGRLPEDDYPSDSAASSPGSAATSLPSANPLVLPPSRGSDIGDNDYEKDPSSGPRRTRSVSALSAKSEREKRKRSRVTPEQLVHLERFFSVDRSPTAARRREISELLGMQERQTQIWFQNRRAKAKLQDGKLKGRSGSTDTPPDTPPELSTGFEVDLHNLIHEDEPVTIIPCTDLSIGTWRRIATTVGKHDLVAYVCDVKRCLTWYIHSGGYGFKMEIPFDTIVDTEFTNAAPGSGLASFVLSQPPTFFLEHLSSPRPNGSINRHWKQCADWTEGHQATKILRHDLIGSAVQLAHLLRSLHSGNPGLDMRVQSPSYHAEPPSTPMELPPPPMAGLTGLAFPYRNDTVDAPSPDYNQQHSRRRSFSGSVVVPNPGIDGYTAESPRQPVTAPSSSFPPTYSHNAGRTPHPASSYGSQMYTTYSTQETSSLIDSRDHSVNEYGHGPVTHGMAPRSYSAQPVPRTFYRDDTRLLHPNDGLRRHSSANHLHYDHTPSPPLLTTPYHPPPHIIGNMTSGHDEGLETSASPISGLPGVTYERSDQYREDVS